MGKFSPIKAKQKEEEQNKLKKEQEEIKLKEIEKQKGEEQAKLVKESDHLYWVKAIFGGILLFGSSMSIFFLFKYKKKFMYN